VWEDNHKILSRHIGPSGHPAPAHVLGVAGRVQTPQSISPAGQDGVLGDLAYARAGGTLVLWRSGRRGADPVGPQRVFANFRRAGTTAFDAPEAVSDTTSVVPAAPSAAVNPQTGAAVAAFGYLTPSVLVSAAPRASGRRSRSTTGAVGCAAL
jgi:hypothetical protein